MLSEEEDDPMHEGGEGDEGDGAMALPEDLVDLINRSRGVFGIPFSNAKLLARHDDAMSRIHTMITSRRESCSALILSASSLSRSIMSAQLSARRWKVIEAQKVSEVTRTLQEQIDRVKLSGASVSRLPEIAGDDTRVSGRNVLRRKPMEDAIARLVVVDCLLHESIAEAVTNIKRMDEVHRLGLVIVLLAAPRPVTGQGFIIGADINIDLLEAYHLGFDLVIPRHFDHTLADFFTEIFLTSSGRWLRSNRSINANYNRIKQVLAEVTDRGQPSSISGASDSQFEPLAQTGGGASSGSGVEGAGTTDALEDQIKHLQSKEDRRRQRKRDADCIDTHPEFISLLTKYETALRELQRHQQLKEEAVKAVHDELSEIIGKISSAGAEKDETIAELKNKLTSAETVVSSRTSTNQTDRHENLLREFRIKTLEGQNAILQKKIDALRQRNRHRQSSVAHAPGPNGGDEDDEDDENGSDHHHELWAERALKAEQALTALREEISSGLENCVSRHDGLEKSAAPDFLGSGTVSTAGLPRWVRLLIANAARRAAANCALEAQMMEVLDTDANLLVHRRVLESVKEMFTDDIRDLVADARRNRQQQQQQQQQVPRGDSNRLGSPQTHDLHGPSDADAHDQRGGAGGMVVADVDDDVHLSTPDSDDNDDACDDEEPTEDDAGSRDLRVEDFAEAFAVMNDVKLACEASRAAWQPAVETTPADGKSPDGNGRPRIDSVGEDDKNTISTSTEMLDRELAAALPGVLAPMLVKVSDSLEETSRNLLARVTNLDQIVWEEGKAVASCAKAVLTGIEQLVIFACRPSHPQFALVIEEKKAQASEKLAASLSSLKAINNAIVNTAPDALSSTMAAAGSSNAAAALASSERERKLSLMTSLHEESRRYAAAKMEVEECERLSLECAAGQAPDVEAKRKQLLLSVEAKEKRLQTYRNTMQLHGSADAQEYADMMYDWLDKKKALLRWEPCPSASALGTDVATMPDRGATDSIAVAMARDVVQRLSWLSLAPRDGDGSAVKTCLQLAEEVHSALTQGREKVETLCASTARQINAVAVEATKIAVSRRSAAEALASVNLDSVQPLLHASKGLVPDTVYKMYIKLHKDLVRLLRMLKHRSCLETVQVVDASKLQKALVLGTTNRRGSKNNSSSSLGHAEKAAFPFILTVDASQVARFADFYENETASDRTESQKKYAQYIAGGGGRGKRGQNARGAVGVEDYYSEDADAEEWSRPPRRPEAQMATTPPPQTAAADGASSVDSSGEIHPSPRNPSQQETPSHHEGGNSRAENKKLETSLLSIQSSVAESSSAPAATKNSKQQQQRRNNKQLHANSEDGALNSEKGNGGSLDQLREDDVSLGTIQSPRSNNTGAPAARGSGGVTTTTVGSPWKTIGGTAGSSSAGGGVLHTHDLQLGSSVNTSTPGGGGGGDGSGDVHSATVATYKGTALDWKKKQPEPPKTARQVMIERVTAKLPMAPLPPGVGGVPRKPVQLPPL